MDLVMPIKDGFAAIREMRALSTPLARVPIVAVSASAFENTRVQSAAAGCEDFITKPVRLDQVIDGRRAPARSHLAAGGSID